MSQLINMNMEHIAYIRTDFPEKFGIPRQGGLASSLDATIVFEPAFRDPEALRGLEGFSHIWLIWEFSANKRAEGEWQPVVRPPRLGGNRSLGVFATRSPFRPNPIGLSCVKIDSIDLESPDGPLIHVKGADLMDGTPIYDIKPYIKYADCHPDAECGYVDALQERRLSVHIPDIVLSQIAKEKLQSLIEVLELDPRPSYHNDPDRVYGLSFSGYNVRFKVSEDVLKVIEITSL